jgi:Pyridoxamine 5'-phosphate oxidase
MMGKLHAQLDDRLIEFIERQHVFFVGTAPSSPDAHLNISPKGLNTFRVLGPTTVAYLDLTGSGIETVAHLRENGRMTIMFCAFEGAPLILRLYGRGRVVEPGDTEWDELLAVFPPQLGERSVIVLEIDRIADSCGFAVPVYEYRRERTQLTEYARRKGRSGMEKYKSEKNRESIDGLEGLAGLAGAE